MNDTTAPVTASVEPPMINANDARVLIRRG
jgi:hypothetical protein